MRILHVVNSMDPNAGGPPFVVAGLSVFQSKLGHGVNILAYAPSNAIPRIQGLFRSTDPDKKVQLKYLPPANRVERMLTPNATRVLRELLPDTDILHLHGVWDPILKTAGSLALAFKKPYIITPHGMLDPWSLSQNPLKKKIALLLGYRSLLNKAAFIHILNPDEESGLKPLGLKSPLQIIPNGVFPDEINNLPPQGLFNAKFNPQNRRFILFLSRIHYKKGLDYLVDAFAAVAQKMDDVDLLIAGPDDGETQPTLDRIARHNLQNRARCIGPLYGADRFKALVDCALFCLPSRQEGFSMAITEAMGAARPVVISDMCHFDEVASANAGKVVPLSSQAVADALLDILSNPVNAEQMGQNARNLIQQKYTWPAIADLSIQTYQQAIKG